jgi:uncharacterized membrane protein YfhO
MKNGYDVLEKVHDVTVMKNRYALPLGFTYTRYIPKSVFDDMPAVFRRIAVMKGFVIDDSRVEMLSDFKQVSLTELKRPYTFEVYGKDVASLRSQHLNITEHGQNSIKGTIDLTEKRLVFFSIPFDKGWQALVDGKPAKLLLVNVGFMGLVLDQGQHKVALRFSPRFWLPGTFISLFSIFIYLILVLIRHRKSETKRSY